MECIENKETRIKEILEECNVFTCHGVTDLKHLVELLDDFYNKEDIELHGNNCVGCTYFSTECDEEPCVTCALNYESNFQPKLFQVGDIVKAKGSYRLITGIDESTGYVHVLNPSGFEETYNANDLQCDLQCVNKYMFQMNEIINGLKELNVEEK